MGYVSVSRVTGCPVPPSCLLVSEATHQRELSALKEEPGTRTQAHRQEVLAITSLHGCPILRHARALSELQC